MNAPERLAAPRAPRASIAINNLRAAVVVFVVAAHSIIAYLWSLPPRPFAFDRPPFSWRTFPIVDTHHFIGFDILCAWADLFLMALFFLMSGLFVWQSLERNGALDFAYRRVLRLGPPFVFGIAVLMPLTNYTTYMQTAAHPGLADFWMHWRALPFWPAGPNWFLWVLLVADISATLFFALLPRGHRIVLGLSRTAREHPARFLAGLLAASTLAYVPFGILFGPMSWFQWGPFSFQLSFPGLYAVYFFAGIIIGACGVRGEFAHTVARPAVEVVARRRAFALRRVARRLGDDVWQSAATSLAWNFVNAIALPPACFASCCCALALAMRFCTGAYPIARQPAAQRLRNLSTALPLRCVAAIRASSSWLACDRKGSDRFRGRDGIQLGAIIGIAARARTRFRYWQRSARACFCSDGDQFSLRGVGCRLNTRVIRKNRVEFRRGLHHFRE